MIANNTIDINSNNRPVTTEPIAISVEGIEKYLVSLKIAITIIEYTIPIVIRIKPGIPKNFRGCFTAINSNREVITSAD